MRITNLLILPLTALISLTGTTALTDVELSERIIDSFKLMYKQISYASYYMKRRIDKLGFERPALNSYVKAMTSDTEKVLCELGFIVEKELPLRTSSLDITHGYSFAHDPAHFQQYPTVESKIRSGVELMLHSFSFWKLHFNHLIGFLSLGTSRPKNDNVFKLVYHDFVMIFFPITRLIYQHYNVKFKSVKPEEIYSKGLYVNAIKLFSGTDNYEGFNDESLLIQLIKRTYWSDADLINRMFKDIKSQVKTLPNYVQSLFNIFQIYQSNLNKV
ncbi:hypothetical protein TpMuguga_01g01197 [Theileria parva strain Muguga]|uniref:uncharacterized protein n=1 Tax=Theileria parva strain Muguga TaxID=333668 RepID=UPI001C6172F1|nr:uncharacterized protein TpMuguga_01g01197 [Theileria parva strain Muguga]EAN34435.2 hypothetical protein TpMuguga_01g01197 [Theileria parva strain Muguga]